MQPKTVLIDLDNTSVDFLTAKQEQHCPMERPFPQGRKGFYLNLKPMPDAVEAIHAIENDPRYNVYFCTAPSMSLLNTFCWSEKAESVIRLFGEKFYHRLIMAFDKSMVNGEILIDDLSKGRGQERFKGEFILFGSEQYPDWQSIMNHLNIADEHRVPLINTEMDIQHHT
jgi:5'(3')-deoxyribonucleotidase